MVLDNKNLVLGGWILLVIGLAGSFIWSALFLVALLGMVFWTVAIRREKKKPKEDRVLITGFYDSKNIPRVMFAAAGIIFVVWIILAAVNIDIPAAYSATEGDIIQKIGYTVGAMMGFDLAYSVYALLFVLIDLILAGYTRKLSIEMVLFEKGRKKPVPNPAKLNNSIYGYKLKK
ncbi:hypothetical protein [Methanolapillus ohkumae]|uniref:Uncharacterized protein n=1 Tax=Methanolapillus ohkumae TaxID=3028298 RepID=A0AA96V5W1_9EURY|nr:hypothetical protein MsAm2_10890 [Methanosarcinaceae archaeon Am2]